jgi:ring-1,2-phenylacetyl-CoA epoxidase subunit PaaC
MSYDDDHVYSAITEDNDDTRWAYGTGFSDPLAGVDTAVPEGVDGADLAAYCLMLGDDALVMSHRLQEWCARAPELEDDVALANIGLDLLGQARLLLTRAGHADGTGRSEDALAFHRDAADFRNVRLVEVANGDFAHTIVRLLVFATWRLALLTRLVTSADPVLAAVADKGVKEVTYHRDYAARWLLRLGDGTEVSRERALDGLAAVWPLTGELFAAHPVEARLAAAGVAVDPADLRGEFDAVLDEVLAAATLPRPADLPSTAGRDGEHTGDLAGLLAVMQELPRAHPDATW